MTVVDLFVRNGRVVTPDGIKRGGVLVTGGRIVDVVSDNPDQHATEVIDAAGMLVMPGLVDAHVHFSEPGHGEWEGFETGSHAAAAGGVTTIAEMPLNAIPPTTDRQSFLLKREAAKKSIVDYALWGGLVTDNTDDLECLYHCGVIGFKAFMCNAGSDFPMAGQTVLARGMSIIGKLPSFLAVHAEDEEAVCQLTANLRALGRGDIGAWGEARPVIAELSAIRSAIALAEEYNTRLHIVHVSCAAGIDLISAAKRRGVAVTAETCPHYLYFSDSDFDKIGPEAKCAPPLRPPHEVEALWERVLAGEVDVIGSDHSPCLENEKAIGQTDIFEAWGGISGLQSTLPAMITAGVRSRGLSLLALARMTAEGPARLLGLDHRKGRIARGFDADLVIVDPDESEILEESGLHYRNRHSAYVGEKLYGAVQRTILRGETIYCDGRFSNGPPSGIFLAGAGLQTGTIVESGPQYGYRGHGI